MTTKRKDCHSLGVRSRGHPIVVRKDCHACVCKEPVLANDVLDLYDVVEEHQLDGPALIEALHLRGQKIIIIGNIYGNGYEMDKKKQQKRRVLIGKAWHWTEWWFHKYRKGNAPEHHAERDVDYTNSWIV